MFGEQNGRLAHRLSFSFLPVADAQLYTCASQHRANSSGKVNASDVDPSSRRGSSLRTASPGFRVFDGSDSMTYHGNTDDEPLSPCPPRSGSWPHPRPGTEFNRLADLRYAARQPQPHQAWHLAP